MSFHNTTHESGDKLEQYGKQTATQDNRVAAFFESNPDTIYTPWEVKTLVFDKPGVTPTPITSIRRTMSDLTRIGVLTKTEHLKEVGDHGRRSYAWMLNENYRETQMLLIQSDKPGTHEVLEELDKDLGPQDPSQGVRMGDLLEPVLEGAKKIEAQNRPKKSPQARLPFEVPQLEPVNCSICGKLLTHPHSIKAGVGPVCQTKCTD